jgi:hypothetical protein
VGAGAVARGIMQTRGAPMRHIIAIALLSAACAAGCDAPRKPATPATATTPSTPAAPAPTAAPAEAPTHGVAGVTPGSHEDWCGEHQVPESMCTRCNATLIPAFKATGDWCVEHNLPRSQCLVCDPTLKIERPAKTSAL